MKCLDVDGNTTIEASGRQFACRDARRASGVLKRSGIVFIGMRERAGLRSDQQYEQQNEQQYARGLPVFSANPCHACARYPISRNALFYDIRRRI